MAEGRRITLSNFSEKLAEGMAATEEAIAEVNSFLLSDLAIHSHSYNGLNQKATDAIMIRADYKERYEIWRQMVRPPSKDGRQTDLLGHSEAESICSAEGNLHADGTPVPEIGNSKDVEDANGDDAADTCTDLSIDLECTSEGSPDTPEEEDHSTSGSDGGSLPRICVLHHANKANHTEPERLTIKLKVPATQPAEGSQRAGVTHKVGTTRKPRHSPLGASSKGKSCAHGTRRKSPHGEPDGLDADPLLEALEPEDEEDAPIPTADGESSRKCKRGRPLSPNPLLTLDKALSPSDQSFSIAAFIDMELPAKVVKPKTSWGMEKQVKQDLLRFGPFQIQHQTTWEGLLNEVARCVLTNRENLSVLLIRWRWTVVWGKDSTIVNSQFLPLVNVEGFEWLMKSVRNLAVSGALTGNEAIIISMGQPHSVRSKPSLPWTPLVESHKAQPVTSEGSERTDAIYADGIPGSSQGLDLPPFDSLPCAESLKNKVALEETLAPILEVLMRKHPVGTCNQHPGLRCYQYALFNWHFELNSVRLKVWAAAIYQRQHGVNYDIPPIGSQFFQVNQTNNGFHMPVGGNIAPGRLQPLGTMPAGLQPTYMTFPAGWGVHPAYAVQYPSYPYTFVQALNTLGTPMFMSTMFPPLPPPPPF
ncbi:hypothetical protein C8Q73DRAFT_665593 [Cubamyces lactineus]|nr:hypothetical protein C8Q73DRAFT_665593 [Cubamyces lactineus]